MRLVMDLQYFAGEKTERATPKKRMDERRKGKVAKSQDINTSILLVFCFLALFVFGSFMLDAMLQLFIQAFTMYIHSDVTFESVPMVFNSASWEAAKMLAPIMLIAIIAGFGSNLLQVGFLFTTEPLKFDLKKIDPIQGAKRIFSIRAIVELLKSLFKITFIGAVTFSIIWIFRDDVLMLAFSNAENALALFGRIAIIMGIASTAALFFLAILDYLYQRYDFEKNMKMSKQDIKDEYKNMEGDPLIKSKIKEKQRMIATRRMMAEVPDADVVITNPTHYAIAIKYNEERASAPYILAKGVDRTALKIREIAAENNVIVYEDKPLARALYSVVEVGDVIPEEYYQAIAEVLAYIYQVEQKA
ncbi:flagellar biosynthesis protein FlhB [Oceanobacillus sp. CAU 1775]